MADAMEDAFLSQWDLFNPELPKPTGKKLEGMRLMFVAVSQGVVQHLRDNEDAFKIADDSAGGTSHDHGGQLESIQATGTTA